MDYNNFNYLVEIPTAFTNGKPLYVDNSSPDKTAVVLQIQENSDGTYRVWSISQHTKMKAAEKKASISATDYFKRYPNDAEKTDFIAFPITRLTRENTYFDKVSNNFGNANEQLIIDTSTWTISMWQRLQWNYSRYETAKHFEAGIHDTAGRTSVYNEVSKSWETKPTCSICYLDDAHLNTKK